jgi:hypothetical protein
VTLVRVRNVHALGLSPDLRPFLASLANGGSVDKRSEVLESRLAGVATLGRVDSGLEEKLVIGIDLRREDLAYLDVLGQEAIEEVDVGGPQVSQIAESLQVV